MKLVLYSNHSIAKMEKWVKKYFVGIKNKNVERPAYKEIPFDTSSFSKMWNVVPIKDTDKLELYWVIQNVKQLYKYE
jgi:secreted Zn-dependent insulinase-like peptidase